jgi:hypothetical protein
VGLAGANTRGFLGVFSGAVAGDRIIPPSQAQLTEIIDSVCGLGAHGGQFGGPSAS